MEMALPTAAPATTPLTYRVSIDSVTFPLPPEIGTNDDAIRRVISAYYPGAETARIDRVEKDGVVTITLVKVPGRKGAFKPDAQVAAEAETFLVQCKGGINPAVALYLHVQEIGISNLSPTDQLQLRDQSKAAIKEGRRQEAQLKMALNILAATEPRRVPVLVIGF